MNEEASSDDFHAPSFKILSQTQTQPSYAKDNARSGKSKMEKKTNIQRNPRRREKGKKSKK